MSCKCQDTNSKRCRWELPRDSHSENMRYTVKQERKATRRALRMLERRLITDTVSFR